jgi:molybdenum cofactor biosynthesis enzyme MoaA
MIRRLSIEHPLVAHCNLQCINCDHGSPTLRSSFSDVRQFERDITELGGVLRAETVKLVGGEPLLHPDIAEFVRIAKRSGIANRVQIWTNGLLLHRFEPGDLDGCDDLIISVYPGVGQKWDAGVVKRLSASST